MSRPCFILNIFLYVHSIKRSLYRLLLTRLDYCIFLTGALIMMTVLLFKRVGTLQLSSYGITEITDSYAAGVFDYLRLYT